MSWNSFGHMFRFITWGESHGVAIGCVIDGCPPGIEIDQQDIQKHLDRRKPGQNRFVSQRKEQDQVEILSGIFQDANHKIPLSTGTPISLIIYNKDARHKDYDNIKDILRPGHADITYFNKYGIRDHRGGGRASARETAMRVAVGAIAKKILQQKFHNIKITAAVVQIGEKHINRKNWCWQEIDKNRFFCPDKEAVTIWEEYLDKLRKNQDSCGAMLEIVAQNIPAGLGAPIYAKLDAEIAHAIMGINAVKSVEIGLGGKVAEKTGKFNNDIMQQNQSKISFQTNNAGGILGGISSGQDINVSLSIKPTSSISQEQNTVNLKGQNTNIKIKGRHDPCVGIRAVPVAEAMLAIVLADQMLMQRAQTGRIKPFEIDEIN